MKPDRVDTEHITLLTSLSHCCYVVAPSLIPKKSGERLKNGCNYPVVNAIQEMWSVRLLVALGTIAELGNLHRFDHPRKLMAYLGLVPTESSSGNKTRRGSLTKCGNSRARRLLIEGAHTYKYKANISFELQQRQEGLPKEIVDIAWHAQQRLCRRYQRLL